MEAVTERLHIRDLVKDDLEPMVSLWVDEGVRRGMGGWGPQKEEEVLPWIEETIKHNEADPRFAHNSVIVERSSGQVIGWIGFGEPSEGKEEFGDIDFGYSMRPEFRGRGYATEALTAVIDYCFNELAINSFFGETMADNLPSIRVMEKAGMRAVGIAADGHIRFQIERAGDQPLIEPFSKPEWRPLPRVGCRNVEGRVLAYEEGDFLVSMLRFGPDGTIDEHPGDSTAEVFCLEGRGFVSVGETISSFGSGQRVTWPKGVNHKLWTTSDQMQVLILHRDLGSGVTRSG